MTKNLVIITAIMMMMSGICMAYTARDAISIQGRIAGVSIPETGTTTINKMTFRVYMLVDNSPRKIGNDIVINNVKVVDQVFNAVIPTEGMDLPPRKILVSVAVGSGPESEKQEIYPVPYAIHAIEAFNGTPVFIVRDKLGVGTTSPSQKISAGRSVQLDYGNVNNGAQGDPWIQFGADNSGEGIRSKKTSGGGQYGLDFITNNSARMSISAAGNVGIGTPEPSTKLEVVGKGMNIKSENGANEIEIANTVAGAVIMSKNNNLNLSSLGTTGGSNMVIINSGGGNVGIGNSTKPRHKLDVAGRGRFGSGTNAQKSGGINILCENNTGEVYAYDEARNEANDLLLNPYGGQVGIGAIGAEPKCSLDVAGAGRFRGMEIRSSTNSSSAGGNGVDIQFGNNKGYVFAIERTINGDQPKDMALSFGYALPAPDPGNYIQGGLGVGVVNPTAALDVGGSIRFRNYTGAEETIFVNRDGELYVGGASDIRLKRNIETISEKMDVIEASKKLRGVYFKWNTDIERVKRFGNSENIGMIAQEAEKALPEVVATEKDGNKYKIINYEELAGFLFEVNKAQQEQIEKLEERYKALENKIENK